MFVVAAAAVVVVACATAATAVLFVFVGVVLLLLLFFCWYFRCMTTYRTYMALHLFAEREISQSNSQIFLDCNFPPDRPRRLDARQDDGHPHRGRRRLRRAGRRGRGRNGSGQPIVHGPLADAGPGLGPPPPEAVERRRAHQGVAQAEQRGEQVYLYI